MSFQPYPSSGNEITPQLTGGPAPQSVQTAVKIMYAGAALSLIGIIATAVTSSSVRPYIEKHIKTINGKPATATQITGLVHFEIAIGIAGGVIGLVLWLWMARKNGQGRPWARILSTVLFALCTLDLVNVFRGGSSAFSTVAALLTWLAGLGAVIFLWLPSSSPYFVSQRRR
ncbi:MAG TPA: hypothetical protein VGG16_20600 [Streptosporangiaceae bacterium]|jgi:hypothetical protein